MRFFSTTDPRRDVFPDAGSHLVNAREIEKPERESDSRSSATTGTCRSPFYITTIHLLIRPELPCVAPAKIKDPEAPCSKDRAGTRGGFGPRQFRHPAQRGEKLHASSPARADPQTARHTFLERKSTPGPRPQTSNMLVCKKGMSPNGCCTRLDGWNIRVRIPFRRGIRAPCRTWGIERTLETHPPRLAA